MENMEKEGSRSSKDGLLSVLQNKDEKGSSGDGTKGVFKNPKGFEKINFNTSEITLFEELKESIEFEDICKGRKGAVLVEPYKEDHKPIPIVRTTTKYNKPVQRFTLCHDYIMNKIKRGFKEKDIEFNNAMIEIYDSNYRTMGYHTDQALDLKDKSYICLFSCYEKSTNPEDIRKLKVKNKVTNEYNEILLEDNSAVLFSTETNKEHIHKIVLDLEKDKHSNNRWLGITFRYSRTKCFFIGGVPHIINWRPERICLMGTLRIANDEERKEFYKHKKNENNNIEYDYPDIYYTISPSDILPIE